MATGARNEGDGDGRYPTHDARRGDDEACQP